MALLHSSSFFIKSIAEALNELSREEKYKLVSKFWPHSGLLLEQFNEDDYNAFIRYLGGELSLLHQHRHKFAVETFDATIELVQFLKDHRSKSLSSLIQTLNERFLNFDEKAIQRSLELSIRLGLTLNVNSPSVAVGSIFRHESNFEWPAETSLDSLIQNQFSKTILGGDTKARSRIDPAFTAAYLVNICGIKLHWTNNLSNHLEFDRKGQILTIYQHKICLINHIKAEEDTLVPKDVLEEALDTLVLLFPFGDSSIKQLLARDGQSAFYGLGNCNRNRSLDLARYKYWNEELQDLIDAFNEPPRSWKQLLTDRRNMMDWAAFWIAVMVAVLTLVSIPCNIVQAVYSVKGYHLTLMQANITSQG